MLKKQKFIKHLLSNMKFNSKYEVALAILKKLNPDIKTTPKNNYEVALAVLEAIKNGGGTSSEPLYLYANNSTSSFNWNGTEIPNLEYSLDGGKTYQLITDNNSISLPEKTKVYLRGQNLSGITKYGQYFNLKGKVSVGGNLGSVINGIDPTETVNTYIFSYFFYNGNTTGNGVFEVFDDFTIPKLDEVNLYAFFEANKILEKVTNFDTSNATNLSRTFSNCTNLKQLPPKMDTSKCTNFNAMFADGCTKLTTIPTLDLSLATSNSNLNNMFSADYNYNLENITFTGSINTNLSFQYCPNLSFDSVKSILTAASNTTKTTSKTLRFSSSLIIKDPNGELPPLISACTSKGWTFSNFNVEVG